MRIKGSTRKLVLGMLLLGVAFWLSGCTSMEGKRDKFLEQGKVLYQKGDYIRARLQFRNALQIDPKFAEGHLWIGKTELKLNNFRGAFGSFSQAAELKPGQTRKEVEGVFVLTKDNKAQFVVVKSGIAGDKYFEVLNGLKAGDKVITGPFDSVRALADDAPVKVDESGKAAPAKK